MEISEIEWADRGSLQLLVIRLIDLIHKHGGEELANKIADDLETDVVMMEKENGIQAH